MVKISFDTSEFDDLFQQLKKLSDSETVKNTVETALKEVHKVVTAEAESAMSKHIKSGKTAGSLERQANVIWEGSKAYVNVGYNIHKGGLPSIFLMYGTPRMRKDQKLYNAFYGKSTKTQIHDIIEENLRNAILKNWGK